MSFNEETQKYFAAAFKPLAVAESKSLSTAQPGPFAMAFPLECVTEHPTVKKTKIELPNPSYNSSVVIPLICDIKTKLAKLEEELYSKSGPEMRDVLEKTLGQLSSTDLDTVIEAIGVLCEILNRNTIQSYQPYLTGKGDRILMLVTKQFRNFFTHYWQPDQPQPEGHEAKLQTLLTKCMQIVASLFQLPSPIKLSESVSREAIHDFMQAVLPFLANDAKDRTPTDVMYRFTGRGANSPNWLRSCIFHMSSQLAYHLRPFSLCGITKDETPMSLVDVRDVAKFLSVILRLLRDFTSAVHFKSADLSAESREHLHLCINALTGLLESFLQKQERSLGMTTGLTLTIEKMDLSSVFYEMYSLFELYSGINNFPIYSDITAVQQIRAFILLVFKTLGEKAWSHFALIDKELAASGKSADNVVIVKMLADRGFVRPSQVPKNTVKKAEVVVADIGVEPLVDIEKPGPSKETNNKEVPKAGPSSQVKPTATPQNPEINQRNENNKRKVRPFSGIFPTDTKTGPKALGPKGPFDKDAQFLDFVKAVAVQPEVSQIFDSTAQKQILKMLAPVSANKEAEKEVITVEDDEVAQKKPEVDEKQPEVSIQIKPLTTSIELTTAPAASCSRCTEGHDFESSSSDESFSSSSLSSSSDESEVLILDDSVQLKTRQKDQFVIVLRDGDEEQAAESSSKKPEVVDLTADDAFVHVEADPEVPETQQPDVVPEIVPEVPAVVDAVAPVPDPKAEAKKNKEEILRQVQKMHEEMVKSQSMINELLSKINKSK